jgi:hypothetical protein
MPRRSHRCPRWELQSVREEAEPAIEGTEAASEPSTSEAEFPARTGRRAEPCSKQAEGVSAGFDEDRRTKRPRSDSASGMAECNDDTVLPALKGAVADGRPPPGRNYTASGDAYVLAEL